MKLPRLLALEGRFAVCKLDRGAGISVPEDARFFCVTCAQEELSVVCGESDAPEGSEVEGGWRALKVEGPLEFSVVGVISSLTKPLADAEIPVFVVSTFDTDYLFVKYERFEETASVLSGAGYDVVEVR